jgi:hypothetical protein
VLRALLLTLRNPFYIRALQLMRPIVRLWHITEHDTEADMPRLQETSLLTLLRRDSEFSRQEVSETWKATEQKSFELKAEISVLLSPSRSICLCHVCSEIRDIYKKTGAWFYKGLPKYELPSRSNGDAKSEARDHPPKVIKTTKLGMEIESDEDEDDGMEIPREEQKIVKNGSFSSSFLKSRNLFNLRLSTDSGSKFTFDLNSPLPKKSPVTPYSRQASSTDSQKSANSLQPQTNESEGASPNSVIVRARRNSISSCYSISEGCVTESFTMNQSEFVDYDFAKCVAQP